MYKFLLILTLFLSTLLFFSSKVQAHPGNTAADGCHYCRTNCDKWGVPWNERHCHGGGAPTEAPPQTVTAPAPVKKVVTPSPKAIVSSPRPVASPRPAAKCSDISDSLCPNNCTAGNDSDCCGQKLKDYQWYPNRGCYPKNEAQCSATADGICSSQCTAGNDADCCTTQLSGYKWYNNWGCYPQ